MKRITIDVADDFEATADDIMDMLTSAQMGVIYGVQIDDIGDLHGGHRMINILQVVYAAMGDDDVDSEAQSERILKLWEHGMSTADKELVDQIFVCLCGWSLSTIIAGEAR